MGSEMCIRDMLILMMSMNTNSAEPRELLRLSNAALQREEIVLPFRDSQSIFENVEGTVSGREQK